ncbi:MAG: hypothetical protein QW334_01955, partial [Thermofilum sp.]
MFFEEMLKLDKGYLDKIERNERGFLESMAEEGRFPFAFVEGSNVYFSSERKQAVRRITSGKILEFNPDYLGSALISKPKKIPLWAKITGWILVALLLAGVACYLSQDREAPKIRDLDCKEKVAEGEAQ